MKRASRYGLAVLLREAGVSRTALAEAAGVARATVDGWARMGLSPDQADHAATSVGLHSLSVWPDMEMPDPHKTCRCGDLFLPSVGRQIWCTPGCRSRHGVAARYRRDPEYREAKKAAAREAYAALSPAARRAKIRAATRSTQSIRRRTAAA